MQPTTAQRDALDDVGRSFIVLIAFIASAHAVEQKAAVQLTLPQSKSPRCSAPNRYCLTLPAIILRCCSAAAVGSS